MPQIELKPATVHDLETIQSIGGQTFCETFEDTNTKKNLDLYISRSFSTPKLRRELQNHNSQFFLATHKKEVIGYLKVNFGPTQTEIKDEKALEIERIYVLKQFYGKGVGQLLFDKALEVAIQSKCEYIWLGVWEKNYRALNFYQKNGFVEFDTHEFVMGESRQTDKLMKLEF